MGLNLTREGHLDGDQRIVSLVGHSLQITGDTAVGLCVGAFSKAARHFLFDLAHSKVTFRPVVCEGDMRQLCE